MAPTINMELSIVPATPVLVVDDSYTATEEYTPGHPSLDDDSPLFLGRKKEFSCQNEQVLPHAHLRTRSGQKAGQYEVKCQESTSEAEVLPRTTDTTIKKLKMLSIGTGAASPSICENAFLQVIDISGKNHCSIRGCTF